MNARPAMISYQDNETRSLLFIRPDVIDRISSDGNTAIIHFSDGTTSLTAEKPSAIAARIKASEASGAGIDSPAHETGSPTLHEDKDRAPSPFQQVVDRNLTMTYCMVGPKQKAMLAIVRQKQGSFTSTYIQYRDNQTDCYPRLTISVEANGNAVAQILMQGDGPSFDRIKTIDLATLLALATNWNPPRNSAIPFVPQIRQCKFCRCEWSADQEWCPSCLEATIVKPAEARAASNPIPTLIQSLT